MLAPTKRGSVIVCAVDPRCGISVDFEVFRVSALCALAQWPKALINEADVSLRPAAHTVRSACARRTHRGLHARLRHRGHPGPRASGSAGSRARSTHDLACDDLRTRRRADLEMVRPRAAAAREKAHRHSRRWRFHFRRNGGRPRDDGPARRDPQRTDRTIRSWSCARVANSRIAGAPSSGFGNHRS